MDRVAAKISAVVVTAGLVTIGSTAGALAQSPPNWTGFSIYAGGGGAAFGGDVNVSDTTAYGVGTECYEVGETGWRGLLPCVELGPIGTSLTNAITSNLNGGSAFGTVGVGADFEPVQGVVVGAFADVDFFSNGASFSGTGSTYLIDSKKLSVYSTTSVTGKVDYDYAATIGGRIGLLSIDRKALGYVLIGWTHVEAGGTAQIQNAIGIDLHGGKYGTSFDANPITARMPDSYDGLTLGLGAEAKLSNSWSIKLEGRYTNLQSQSVQYTGSTTNAKFLGYTEYGFNGCGGKWSDCAAYLKTTADSKGKIDIDPDIWSGRVVLSFKLN